MSKVFTQMGIKLKADTLEQFAKWLKEFQKGAKPKSKSEPSFTDGAAGGSATSQILEKTSQITKFQWRQKGRNKL